MSIWNQVRESEAQLTALYNARLQMDIQLEWIIAYTYTMDDVYQLALKIEGLKFQASKHPSHKLGVLSPTKQQANHLAQQFPKLQTM